MGTMTGGHYTAYARHRDDGTWLCYDDHSVREVSPKMVKSTSAYVLFYKRQDIPWPPFDRSLDKVQQEEDYSDEDSDDDGPPAAAADTTTSAATPAGTTTQNIEIGANQGSIPSVEPRPASSEAVYIAETGATVVETGSTVATVTETGSTIESSSLHTNSLQGVAATYTGST